VTCRADDLGGYQALGRQPGETLRAYAAFLDYVRLGEGRSLRRLLAQYTHGENRERSEYKPGTARPPTRRFATLAEWSAKYGWQERLAAYKAERAQHEQAVWEERRRAVREADWSLGWQLRELVQRLLAQTELDADALLKALKLASELQRLAAEVPPPKQTHDVHITHPTPISFIRVAGASEDDAGSDSSRNTDGE
jgi:hypothetical protein